ncbi:nicotinamide riboside transporter PnuC [Bailinhaonella thermotolerans]|uniref:Nicotinamide riboside transporter PnuC n=1 Tax=Bailinhaonella thermotolerans TaxID=1070861 RepID=A0A3A4A6E2_9ACTN|nr:nicotinamide riboside transporter PnuC [Bailinhaonella thermotolerans]RJL24476.1 nicotinamide riboside transporter PnuC [Bailinhaonella thermotolerans]
MSLHELLGPLLQPAFHVGEVPTTWAELLGFVTGAVNVFLVVRQNILNWPIGIANVILLGLVFLDGGLYADAGLQVVYVGLQAYGWWVWLYGGEGRDRLPVTRTSRGQWAGLLAAGAAATALLTWALSGLTDSNVPFWDALTTSMSLMAIYGQSRKLLESWWIWIAVDLVYIPLYWYKDLKLTSVLYVVFLTLCVAGLLSWRRAFQAGREAPAAATA